MEHPLVAQLRKLLKPKKHWTRRKYKRYLRSAWWREKREEKLASQAYKCERCGGTADQVHHKHYDSLYEELNEDLVAICDPCHRREHGKKPKRKKRQ